MTDVLVIGAGPAGMSAALELRARGIAVTVVDDQPAPGGRIFAAIEQRVAHGREDSGGASLVAKFRAAGGTYLPSTEVWQIEPGPRVFMSQEGVARMIEPRLILMAAGAQERPMPFPGWQLPGVMTIGAAQILLKTARQIPDHPVWLAGSGPLLLLYAHQLIAAGGSIAGILDTTPPGALASAAGLLPTALPYGWRDLARGVAWLAQLRRLHTIRYVSSLEGIGESALTGVRYTTANGESGEVAARLLFIHNGVIPGIHATLAAGCEHRWNPRQRTFEPTVDDFGRSSVAAIFIAGDGATIAGARAAELSGRRAALGVALTLECISAAEADRAAMPIRRKLAASTRFRNLVDALYPPIDLLLPDATLVCRCEEVNAGTIRAALSGRPQLGPDGLKVATRAGMGPCQGRQCGLSLVRLLTEVNGIAPETSGFLRIRPPLKPLTMGELASLETGA